MGQSDILRVVDPVKWVDCEEISKLTGYGVSSTSICLKKLRKNEELEWKTEKRGLHNVMFYRKKGDKDVEA